uniref:Tumor protein p53 inducible nuclear protein 1 n=1 Tax=Gasterosteus aculeatus TaxID=69293 RepID=G3Q0P9_GASAC
MFQRFTSALFGDDGEELSRRCPLKVGEHQEVNSTSCLCLQPRPVATASPHPPLPGDDPLPRGQPPDPLRLLHESWFVTPPPCFTGRGVPPALLEASPLENLLIEHPSMSVYAHHSNLVVPHLPPPPRPPSPCRPEVAVVPRRSTLHSACYAAALSARAGLLQQRDSNAAQRSKPLSRNALRRLNMLRPPKTSSAHLHQPSQRHLNF